MINTTLLKNLIESGAEVYSLAQTDSTNTVAAALPVGSVVVADSQTAGRGRSGNSFVSPKGGLYLSYVTDKFLDRPNLATPAAAVAVHAAIADVCGKNTLIKWVNDVYYLGKKAVGILVERKQSPDRLIIGIGINLAYYAFPDNISAVSLYSADETPAQREHVAAYIVNKLNALALSPDSAILEPYRQHSMLIGKRISFLINGQILSADVIGIADNGNLIVNQNGSPLLLNSGEVHITNF